MGGGAPAPTGQPRRAASSDMKEPLMAPRRRGPSQLVDLFLSVARSLGIEDDRDLAALADVVTDNVGNWRSGAVREFKLQTLEAIKDRLGQHLTALRRRADATRDAQRGGLRPVFVEEGSSPDELLEQFQSRLGFDYLGHRFLYYEPQGAIAWLNLIQAGYEQDAWLRGTREAAQEWFDAARDRHGRPQSPLLRALGHGTRPNLRGLDVIGLGAGDGVKEAAVCKELLAATGVAPYEWLTLVPVDVSVSLLLRAAAAGAECLGGLGDPARSWRHSVLPVCADFEEGPLRFLEQLPTGGNDSDGLRLVLLLGNVFGNVRDEDRFLRQRLWTLARPGDFVWLEVGVRIDPIELDPLYRMTDASSEETAAEGSRRMLLEGPVRRWEAATGGRPSEIQVRVWLRQDDVACRIPGSVNFCHDLVLVEQRRACTMLYSRRYQIDELIPWLEERDFTVERIRTIVDAKRRPRVTHLLLRRR